MSRPAVQEGDNDNRDVRLLQQLLRDLNYDVGQIDGDFGPVTKAAVIAFQDDHQIGEAGVCGPDTWIALEDRFGDLDGLRAEESVEEYVDESMGAAHQSTTDAEGQLAELAQAANNQLTAAGVPNVPFTFANISDQAAFYPDQWTVDVDRATYDAYQADGDADQNMNTVYHEARHAEQAFLVCRVLAGLHGMDGAAINAATGIREDIADLATADPILESTAESTKAWKWYDEVYSIAATGPTEGTRDSDQVDAFGAGTQVMDRVDELLEGGPADGRRILGRDSNDASEILYLQELLEWRGHSPGAIDGDFGEKTEAAVKSFQLAHGLTDDGIVGPLTWEALLP